MQKLLTAALVLALPVLLALHLNSGAADITLGAAAADWFAGRASIDALIVAEIRLPRALLALCIGLSLGLSGAALQGLLRNPLASPELLGVSQGAALAAVICLYYGYAALAWFALPLAALGGALAAMATIFLLAGRHTGTFGIILAGIALNALCGAAISLALNYAPNAFALQEIYYWLLGSVANRGMNEFWFALPFMAFGWTLIVSRRRFLDALSLGEDSARSLGFDTAREGWILVLGVAACTGAAVAVSGSIGFIGLVVPHLVRPLAGHEPGRVLVLAALAGAALLLAADIAVQTLPGAQELQVGVLT